MKRKGASISGFESGVRELNDGELRERIKAHFPRHGAKLTLEIQNGFVTLQGTVATFREKVRLHRFVMGLRSVRALKDEVRIKPPETLQDREIALHVRRALDAHSDLPPGTAAVQVHEGVCALQGCVRTAEERHVAEMVARNCRGVTRVTNKLKVDPLDEWSDAATARVVKSALSYLDDFETDGISVSCAQGKVALRGTVPAYMDRLMAEEMTRIQPGVRAVENHLQIASHSGLDPTTWVDNAKRKTRVLPRRHPK